MWFKEGATLTLVKCELFLILNLKIQHQKLLMCILWETKFLLDKKKKTILLFSERYCVSVHDISNKELTIKIRQYKHNYYKDFFLGCILKCTTKNREENITDETLSFSLKTKRLGWTGSCSYSHTTVLTYTLLLEHWHTTTSSTSLK